MTVDELSSLSVSAIEDMNNMLVDRADNDLFRIGALWSEISKREVWKAWGYESLPKAIEDRAPRGYSTVMEQLTNYDYFVREGRMGYPAYTSTFTKLGHRKISYLRQTLKVEEQQRPDLAPTQFEIDKHVHKFDRTMFIKTELDKLIPMTVREAKSYVLDRAKESGVEVEQFVDRHYRFTISQDDLIQEEIAFIRKRASGPISDSSALALAIQEHLAQFGTRRIKKD